MDPEEFRSAAHVLVDWIADFRTRLPDLPVQTSAGPGDVRRSLPAAPPDGRESLASLLADLDEVVVPGLTHVQHPRYFGWFPANASLASVLGDIASSGIGALGISWQSAPALTEVEEVVCDWMRQLAGWAYRLTQRTRSLDNCATWTSSRGLRGGAIGGSRSWGTSSPDAASP